MSIRNIKLHSLCVQRYKLAIVGSLIVCTILSLVGVVAPVDTAEAASYGPNSTYRRPYGPNAPWNVPVRNVPRHPESNRWRDRIWNQGNLSGNWNVNVNYDDYTYPVYYAYDATGNYPVQLSNPAWGNIHNTRIPWNPGWRQNDGTDAQIIVLDPATGREWNLWQVEFRNGTVYASNGSLVQAGEDAGNGSNPGNYWTKENGFVPSRGVGIQYYAMLVTPQEVEQGLIPHALSMPIMNPSQEIYVAPATKLERAAAFRNVVNGVPEGMRFALDITDAEIDAYVASLPSSLPAAQRRFARTIAVALRDYGFFVTDSAGGYHLQLEGWESAEDEWRRIGLGPVNIGGKEYPRDILDNLLRRDDLYAAIPSDQYPGNAGGSGFTLPSLPPSLTTGDRVEIIVNSNIRQSAEISTTNRIGVNLQGSRGTVQEGPRTGSNLSWYRVQFDRTMHNGWVAANNLRSLTTTAVTERTPSYFRTNDTVTIFRRSNLRELPALTGTLIRVVDAGTTATIAAGPSKDTVNNIWYQLRFTDGTTGWIASDNFQR